ncbi:MAG: hypoxanthine-guanine phosphoribosyltransferase [Methylotetracoccus sp.]
MTALDHLTEVERSAEIIHSREAVDAAITRIAGEISRTIGDANPVIITVLTGGIVFSGQLLTELDFPLELDAVSLSRYRGKTRGSELHWRLKPTTPLHGRTVLLVDDVLDEGITLAELKRYCLAEGAARVLIAVLVEKRLAREKPCEADFVGLLADDRYLFGYGMDYRNYLRNAPGIYACTHL